MSPADLASILKALIPSAEIRIHPATLTTDEGIDVTESLSVSIGSHARDPRRFSVTESTASGFLMHHSLTAGGMLQLFQQLVLAKAVTDDADAAAIVIAAKTR